MSECKGKAKLVEAATGRQLASLGPVDSLLEAETLAMAFDAPSTVTVSSTRDVLLVARFADIEGTCLLAHLGKGAPAPAGSWAFLRCDPGTW